MVAELEENVKKIYDKLQVQRLHDQRTTEVVSKNICFIEYAGQNKFVKIKIF